MLEQILDVCKAFNLEDLWFLLDNLPEGNGQTHQSETHMHVFTTDQDLTWANIYLDSIIHVPVLDFILLLYIQCVDILHRAFKHTGFPMEVTILACSMCFTC